MRQPRVRGRKTMKSSKLTIATPTEREVVITRVFNARPDLVFDALTKPDLLRLWSLPAGWTFEKCEVDLRVGGKWHFVSSQPGGKRIGQLGTFIEIAAGERLVKTENWEDWDAGETIVTTVLEGDNGETRFTSTLLFPSQEVRDIVLRSGLDKSVGPIYDRLADVLASGAEQTGRANA